MLDLANHYVLIGTRLMRFEHISFQRSAFVGLRCSSGKEKTPERLTVFRPQGLSLLNSLLTAISI
jgi:hypothetical protein